MRDMNAYHAGLPGSSGLSRASAMSPSRALGDLTLSRVSTPASFLTESSPYSMNGFLFGKAPQGPHLRAALTTRRPYHLELDETKIVIQKNALMAFAVMMFFDECMKPKDLHAVVVDNLQWFPKKAVKDAILALISRYTNARELYLRRHPTVPYPQSATRIERAAIRLVDAFMDISAAPRPFLVKQRKKDQVRSVRMAWERAYKGDPQALLANLPTMPSLKPSNRARRLVMSPRSSHGYGGRRSPPPVGRNRSRSPGRQTMMGTYRVRSPIPYCADPKEEMFSERNNNTDKTLQETRLTRSIPTDARFSTQDSRQRRPTPSLPVKPAQTAVVPVATRPAASDYWDMQPPEQTFASIIEHAIEQMKALVERHKLSDAMRVRVTNHILVLQGLVASAAYVDGQLAEELAKRTKGR